MMRQIARFDKSLYCNKTFLKVNCVTDDRAEKCGFVEAGDPGSPGEFQKQWIHCVRGGPACAKLGASAMIRV